MEIGTLRWSNTVVHTSAQKRDEQNGHHMS